MNTVNLFVVKSQLARGINHLFFNAGTTLEEAISQTPALKEREILSAQIEAVEVLPADKKGRMQIAYTDLMVDVSGKIIGQKIETNPNYEELMAIKMSDISEAEGNDDQAEFWKSIGE